MKKPKAFKWFRIVGHPENDATNTNFTFVYFVEALNPQNVVKYYGGKRKYEDEKKGLRLLVQFPNRQQDVMLMPTSWNPNGMISEPNDEPNTITKIIHATRYQCDCGGVRLSDYPYPSMWCSCGHKAFPLQDTFLR